LEVVEKAETVIVVCEGELTVPVIPGGETVIVVRETKLLLNEVLFTLVILQ